mgnify:FL=1|tara:strand:- start:5324 stop:5521 length:198 start_codon:yes stop_codon:yes gene_type:complete
MKDLVRSLRRALGEDEDGYDRRPYLTYHCPTCDEVFEVMFYDPIEGYECIDYRCEGDLCLITAKA